MKKHLDDHLDIDPASLCWIGTIPYALLKPLIAAGQEPGGLLRLDKVVRLLRRLDKHLLSLANSALGRPVVVLYPSLDKVGLAYEAEHQQRLSFGNDEHPAPCTAGSVGEAMAVDEKAVAIAGELIAAVRKGRQPSAEELATIVTGSPNPEITGRVLAQSHNIEVTVAGATQPFDLGGNGRFPKTLTSEQRLSVTLGGFANINESWVEAYVMPIEGQLDNEIARTYFSLEHRYRVKLEGGKHDSSFRQLALWKFQIRATVIPSIKTGRQEIASLTLVELQNLDEVRPLAQQCLHQIQLALNLEEQV